MYDRSIPTVYEMSWKSRTPLPGSPTDRPRDRHRNGIPGLNMIMLLLLSTFLFEGTARGSRHFRTEFLQEKPTPDSGPYFDATGPSHVVGLVGKTVHLLCRVKNAGNRTVSWVRHRDIHLLTLGGYTYTSDQRFEVLHAPHSEEWTLRIRYPQKKDSGIYECQISTTPPIGYQVNLTVVEPITEIVGGPDLFINKGSTINLTCLVKYAPEPPTAMIWSQNQQAINFDSPRGGISLVTEKGPVTSSYLLIQKAIQKDSGLYTCSPSNANPKNVTVHILNEHPAAMHHGAGDRTTATLLPVVLLLRTMF
ncbi:zwei Ig domain protein zig-8 isoform X2 [Orussus abietinus]|uniref:zwei Ig domain protein zig-8 isoform X2 n=1 Tax=Orussus abietinus TaxID=222816 RepID=UPI000C715ECD|nr:zwei Ig domain protein zig-8 isoform X2 [Orussus abietinus]